MLRTREATLRRCSSTGRWLQQVRPLIWRSFGNLTFRSNPLREEGGTFTRDLPRVWTFLKSGAVTVLPITDDDLPAIEDLMDRYQDCPMDFAARRLSSAASELGRVRNQLRQMRATLKETPKADLALYTRLDAVSQAVADLELRLQGDPARQNLSEPEAPSIDERVRAIRDGHWQTRQMPTATQKRNLEIAKAGLDALERDLNALMAGDLAKLEEAFAAAGAPWIPGRRVP